MSFGRLYLWKQYICRFNLNYPIEKTYNAPFWYKFQSKAFKKTFKPNKRMTENSYQKHNTIRTNKKTSKNYRFLRHNILETYNPNLTELILKPVLMYLNVFSYWCHL